MIPNVIEKRHIAEALRVIRREGVPRGRASRGYCLVMDGRHYPPKLAIALAHRIATGEPLGSFRFSGGRPTNDFLQCLAFIVVKCACGGAGRGHLPVQPATPLAVPPPVARKVRPKRHSERCRDCKTRVEELLVLLYGECRPNDRFGWPTRLPAYDSTPLYPALRRIAAALKTYRGFGLTDFVRRSTLAGSDYWVPDPGFLVEFDESQHFTHPRKLALAAYPDAHPLGFPRRRWMALCDEVGAQDNDPPFRDEQRAWYDALRDLVPSLHGLRPTIRLYASDLVWCSLDPERLSDLRLFAAKLDQGTSVSAETSAPSDTQPARPDSVVRIALVFPRVEQTAAGGVPPSEPDAKGPVVPTAKAFANETVDCVLFPEGYVRPSDSTRMRALEALAADLDAPLLVGATDSGLDETERAFQVLLRFDPGRAPSRIYTKHSTAAAIAFEKPHWEPEAMLPTFDLGGVTAAATICHDQYLGLLPRFLARRGARVWLNPSFDNVIPVKWASVLRLRAVENRMFALCTLHDSAKKRNRTHPFAFSPDGRELAGRRPGRSDARPLSECTESGAIYIVELKVGECDTPLDWSRLPPAAKPPRRHRATPRKPVHVAFRNGQLAVLGRGGWQGVRANPRIGTNYGPVHADLIPGESILDAAACFRVLDAANKMKCAPILWNHWDRLPIDSARLANLMLGRAIECCAPILISDRDGLHEVVELAGQYKIPARRTIDASGEAILDMGKAWGLENAFTMVTKHLPRSMRAVALNRYRGLV